MGEFIASNGPPEGSPILYKKFEDLVDKTALIKSLKEPEDKIGEPSGGPLEAINSHVNVQICFLIRDI
jgi:hypothetical protein